MIQGSVAGTEKLDENIRRMMRMADGPTARRAMMAGGLVVERKAKLLIRAQHLIDTGNLRNSIVAEPVSDLVVEIGTSMVYGAIHEFGGTIRPKSARALAIPVNDQAKAVGGPRNYPADLTMIRTKRGGMVLLDGDDIAYVLVKSVNIPAKPYLRPALHNYLTEVSRAIIQVLKDFIATLGPQS